MLACTVLTPPAEQLRHSLAPCLWGHNLTATATASPPAQCILWFLKGNVWHVGLHSAHTPCSTCAHLHNSMLLVLLPANIAVAISRCPLLQLSLCFVLCCFHCRAGWDCHNNVATGVAVLLDCGQQVVALNQGEVPCIYGGQGTDWWVNANLVPGRPALACQSRHWRWGHCPSEVLVQRVCREVDFWKQPSV